jgi:hypothetical protein
MGDLPREPGERLGNRLVQIGLGRALRNGRGRDLLMQELVDLLVKDQRQPGHAQQQHEDCADQAGPLVNPAPTAKRLGTRLQDAALVPGIFQCATARAFPKPQYARAVRQDAT